MRQRSALTWSRMIVAACAALVSASKMPLELGHEVTQLIVRQLRDVAAQQSKALPRLRETGSIDRVRFAIAAVDLARVGADRGPDRAGHDDRAFDVRRVDLQISDQRLGNLEGGSLEERAGVAWLLH